MFSNIQIRGAKLPDAPGISSLIGTFSRNGIMLAKPVDSVIEGIRNFIVAEKDGQLIGCCAVAFFSLDTAEIRSLAVRNEYQRQGIGKMMVQKAEEILKEEAIKTVFALTYNDQFFEKMGYVRVDKMKFPQKIWKDCLGCPKLIQCDEIAVEKSL